MPPLVLASGSVRRAEILRGAGIPFEQRPAALDDGHLRPPPGTPAAAWTVALAYLKAWAVDRECRGLGWVLGADTVCEVGGEIVGKPRDAGAARRMLERMVGGAQRVVTGLALLTPGGGRVLAAEVATVAFGPIEPRTLDAYIESGSWRGKAGGYNLTERLADGWPIAVEGDPEAVVGLPIRVLQRMIAAATAGPECAA
ncbi:MAG: Maf family protein [Planctomycetota bacterium]